MKVVASISGGKDSIAMCLELLRRGERVDDFVFVDTGMEYPECYAAMSKFVADTGRKITRLSADVSFEYLLAHRDVTSHRGSTTRRDGRPKRTHGYGWPSMMRRWCTSKLKQDVLRRYHASLGPDVVECIGIAADEPKRVHDKRYPLVEWGMTEADCLRYCRERGYFPSPCAYDVVGRMSCFCCPMANAAQVRYLINQRPELWAEIKRLEAAAGDPWQGWRGYLADGGLRDCAYFERKYREVQGEQNR